MSGSLDGSTSSPGSTIVVPSTRSEFVTPPTSTPSSTIVASSTTITSPPMAASDTTTLSYYPSNLTVFTRYTPSSPLAIAVPTNGKDSLEARPGFQLYLSYSTTATDAVTLYPSQMVSTLGQFGASQTAGQDLTTVYTGPAFGATTAIAPSVSTVTLSSGQSITLYIPFTNHLSATVPLGYLDAAVKAAATRSPGLPAPNNNNGNGSNNPPSSNNSPGPASSSPSKNQGSLSSGALAGALIGCVLGGLLVGMLAGILLKCWRSRREKRTRRRPSDGIRSSSSKAPLTREIPLEEKKSFIGVGAQNAGWRKHLPQDKDDTSIKKAVSSVFTQAHVFVEGFYSPHASSLLSSKALDALQTHSSQELGEALRHADDAIPLLEGFLIRFIVHAISMRSTEMSLLPEEYTEKCHEVGWHMESDGQENGHARAESRRGFRPAFSEWRVLASFLRSQDPAVDAAYKSALEVKINHAIELITQAFAPWDSPSASPANRAEGLRQILRQASDTGQMIFVQPSTFIFDWSSRDPRGSVVISPAFVKRLDENGEPLRRPVVLVESYPVTA